MRDILISSAVCLACLLVALISQVVAPSTLAAAPTTAIQSAVVRDAATATTGLVAGGTAAAVVTSPVELDPNDPNPFLFTMASSSTPAPDYSDESLLAGAAALGDEIGGQSIAA